MKAQAPRHQPARPPDPGGLDPSWAGLPSSTVADCLGGRQAMTSEIRLLTLGRLTARAWTAWTQAGSNTILDETIATAPPGTALVVDAAAYTERAVWGEVKTVLLPKTSSMLVGAVVQVEPTLYAIAVAGRSYDGERCGMVMDRAAATGLPRHDERVRAAATAADEQPGQGRGDPHAAPPAPGPAAAARS
jgi:hypothetical protein